MSRWVAAVVLAFAAVFAVAASQNWVTTVAKTDGGHLIGNPQAKTKLVEFVSYTCPHCAHFEKEAGGAIQIALVQPGKGSVEVRHIIRDPIDLTAALLANCGPKEKFLGNHDMFLLQQDKWMSKAQLALPSQRQRWGSGSFASRWQAIASDLGFYDMMESRGYSRVEVDKCLADEAAARSIVAESEANSKDYGVNSTPSFALNGKTLDGVHTWDQLQAALGAK